MVRPATRPRFTLMRSLLRPLLYRMTCIHCNFPRGCTPALAWVRRWAGGGSSTRGARWTPLPVRRVLRGQRTLLCQLRHPARPARHQQHRVRWLWVQVQLHGCVCRLTRLFVGPVWALCSEWARSTNSSSGLCSSSTCPTPPLPTALHTGVEGSLLSCFTSVEGLRVRGLGPVSKRCR